MPSQTGTPAGAHAVTNAQNAVSLPESENIVGYAEPLIGRVAQRDVFGYFGFPIIKKGEVVTRAVAERAQSLSRLFELMSATEDA